MLVPVKISSMGKIDLLKYLGSIIARTKQIKKQLPKNIDINVKLTQFPNVLAFNNPKRFNMPLQSINQRSMHYESLS